MGEAAPEWDGPLGDHVKNDFAAIERAVDRRAPAAAGRGRAGRVRRGDRAPGWPQLAERDRRGVGGGRVGSPVGQVPHAVFMEVRVFDSWVHEQDARRALDRPGGSGNRASAIVAGPGAGRHAASSWASRPAAPTAPRSASTSRVPGATRARSPSPSRAGGRVRSDDEVAPTVTLVRCRASTSSAWAAGGPRRKQVEAAGGVGVEGDAAVGRQVLGAMNFMF